MGQQIQDYEKRDWALRYAAAGLKVFPVKQDGKSPAINNWQSESTTDPEKIEKWWENNAEYNIGVDTEGLVVIDVDNKNGKDGSTSLEHLLGNTALETFTVATPSGGFHYYFKQPQDCHFRNKTNILPGIDIRADGGLVVGAGSSIDGKLYSLFSDGPIAIMPSEIERKLLNASCSISLEPGSDTKISNVVRMGPIRPNPLVSPQASLEYYLERIDPGAPHDDWAKVIWAALNCYGRTPETVEVLRQWSEVSEKYDSGEFDKKVRTYDPLHNRPLKECELERLSQVHPRHHFVDLPSISANDRERAERLRDTTFEILLFSMNSSSVLSRAHKEDLFRLCELLAFSAFSGESFKIQYPLETGMGKTSAVKALIQAVVQLGYDDISLCISAFRVQELHEIREDLLRRGLPEDSIGIYHNSDYREVPSVTAEEAEGRQFLLVSHQRLSPQHLKWFCTHYHGIKRSLTIWDESLIQTRGIRLDVSRLIGECGEAEDLCRRLLANEKTLLEKDRFITQQLSCFCYRLAEQLRKADQNSIFELAQYSCAPEELVGLCRKLGGLTVLMQAIEEIGSYKMLSLRRIHGRDLLLGFSQTQVSELVDRVVILDASAGSKELTRLDSSLSLYVTKSTKDYSKVKIRVNRVRYGKGAVKDDLPKEYLNEIEHWIREHLPEGEEALIVSFKEDLPDLIHPRLQSMGSDYIDRIHVLTWGKHRATNKFSHVKFMFFAGVLTREAGELAASILGQRRDLSYPFTKQHLEHVKRTEQVDAITQAINRGNARNVKCGVAGEMDVILNLSDTTVLKLLEKVMPRVQISQYTSVSLKPKRSRINSKASEILEAMLKYLLTYEEHTISIRELRKVVCPEVDTNSPEWRSASKELNQRLEEIGWQRVRQSLVRSAVCGSLAESSA